MASKLKYLIGVGLVLLTGCAILGAGHSQRKYTTPKVESDYAKTAVMITSNSMQSGGTGVILRSSPGRSEILTNKHVCELVQVGGKVITDDGSQYPVQTYRVYKHHDLCLVTVYKNLGVNIKIAKSAPATYSTSTVVGHPALLPTVITSGHFSQWQTIQLMVDVKPCDGTETDDEAMMCFFFGGKPVLRSFAAQVTSSLIMPGSSGSAVFNDKGELSGLIFAGHQGLSYGFMVPWEYINNFLTNMKRYPEQIPNAGKKPENFLAAYFKIQKICDDKIANVSNTCNSMAKLGLWNNE